jgi:CRP-like cAMP-binding protein
MSNSHPIQTKLKEMPIFSSFTDAELEKFLSVSDPSNYRKGEFIIRQGEDGDCMFFLADGSCKVTVHREGRSVELTTLGPGSIFGELAVFEHRPRFADVQALTDCVLVKVSEPMIHALAGLYPAAAYKLLAGIIREIGDRLRKTSVRVLDSLLPDVPPSRD